MKKLLKGRSGDGFVCPLELATWTFQASKFAGKKITNGGHYYKIIGEKVWAFNNVHHQPYDCGKYSGAKVSFVSFSISLFLMFV